LLLIPVLIGVSLLTFFIVRAAGNPVYTYLQNPEKATDLQKQQIIDKYHLDSPIPVQYAYWLNGVLHGDLGWSRSAHESVTHAILSKFPATFELAVTSTIIAVLFGIYAGTKAAVKVNTATDQGVRVVSLLAVSMPVFWLGILLIMVFYNMLGWAPRPVGQFNSSIYSISDLKVHTNLLLIDTLGSGNIPFFLDVVGHLVLPSITLAFATTAIIVRMMRSSMLEVLGAEYVRTARSKGLPENVVINKHARRNALIPTTTVIGLGFGGLLGGAVLTETVFSWNGIGQWSANAAQAIDTAGIMGFTLLTAVIYVLANLVVDIVYAYLDPRVHLG
jgi:ABC-type dipeptide/oligopeptide/nickel transport system permease component